MFLSCVFCYCVLFLTIQFDGNASSMDAPVFQWGTWGCEASKFPWSYESNESCYILKGKVTVTPTDDRKPVTVGEGDFVTFPAGMSCTWDVSEAIHKHFNFF